MAIRYLYLVRHGQFDADLNTNPKGELTPLGVKQAKYLPRAFKHVPINAIHVSTAPRAIQTAEPLIEAFPEAKVTRAHRLLECIPPISAAIRTQYFAHLTDDHLAAEVAHAERAFEDYFKRTGATDRHEVLICHGNLIRYFVCRVMNVDHTAWLNLESRNCGITRFLIDSEGNAHLISYNEVGHLPAELHTDNLHIVASKNGKH
jgi:serine/threonine-protein phosphatase PGAM5